MNEVGFMHCSDVVEYRRDLSASPKIQPHRQVTVHGDNRTVQRWFLQHGIHGFGATAGDDTPRDTPDLYGEISCICQSTPRESTVVPAPPTCRHLNKSGWFSRRSRRAGPFSTLLAGFRDLQTQKRVMWTGVENTRLCAQKRAGQFDLILIYGISVQTALYW